MKAARKFEIFLAAPPGLELVLKAEALERGFKKAKAVPGGVQFRGNWHDVRRANLELRGAGRVLARIDSFRSTHLEHLAKTARAFDWASLLRPDVPVRVEATCARSRIYHQGAAAERVGLAITESLGATISDEAELRVMLRIEDDTCTLSLDTSGAPLHKRGLKQAVGKAPLRETLAALFLRQCGYTGTEPVLDPMCGSGTIPIEAAEIALGLAPGRARSFAFENLANFDADAWARIRASQTPQTTNMHFFGSDRDAGAIRNATENAARSGVDAITRFACHAVSDLERPDGPPGLVLLNPPYGARIGDKRQLFGLYGALGKVLKERFAGWRVGLITTEGGLAKATGLPFAEPGAPVAHGGLKVRLWQTSALP
ncbi:class I SAM-dependent RNA methyltransferase [Roseovarius faecimaris]|uniref:Class I SAM-dependent RNA methyltransferase n=1 Tax=Roseovarius faecimaris TaxID=2494550 RepID=A0A6I6IUN2_9RHOB|nr:class I SAM-dependent RNA methyltransferase [Roseovarius faecimaris]QGX99431.1 class I SAM-dependent RNA methyltransferase [Roseovarius faecimaris]